MSWWYSPLYKIMWQFCTVYTLFYGILWQVLKFFIIHPSTSEHAYHIDYFRTLFKIVSMVTQNTKPLKASTNIAPYPLS